jgi:hypothetical protein
VKELVEQNHQKYETYGVTAGIYSAGLKADFLTIKVNTEKPMSSNNLNNSIKMMLSLMKLGLSRKKSTNKLNQNASSHKM